MPDDTALDLFADRPGVCGICGRMLSVAGGELLVRPCRYCHALICGSCRPGHGCAQMRVTPEMLAAGTAERPYGVPEVVLGSDKTVLKVVGGPVDGFRLLPEKREVIPLLPGEESLLGIGHVHRRRPDREELREHSRSNDGGEEVPDSTKTFVRWALALATGALFFALLSLGLIVWIATSFVEHSSASSAQHAESGRVVERNTTRIDSIEKELDRLRSEDLRFREELQKLRDERARR